VEAANTAGTTTQERPLGILRRSGRASQIWGGQAFLSSLTDALRFDIQGIALVAWPR